MLTSPMASSPPGRSIELLGRWGHKFGMEGDPYVPMNMAPPAAGRHPAISGSVFADHSDLHRFNRAKEEED